MSPVDQRQRALRAQPEEVDERLARPERRLAARTVDARRDRRQFGERLADVGVAARLDLLRVDDLRRLQRVGFSRDPVTTIVSVAALVSATPLFGETAVSLEDAAGGCGCCCAAVAVVRANRLAAVNGQARIVVRPC